MGQSTPSVMKTALDDGAGQYQIHETGVPNMFPGAALIKVRQTGICGSDLHMTNARTEAQTLASGHEVAGEIVELPPGDWDVQVGERVAIEMIGAGRACLNCYYCRFGQYRHCLDQAEDTGGGFAEYMTRRPAGLFKLADSMDWVDGGLVEPMAVSVHAIRYARVMPGQLVAVLGSATIGLSAIAAAKQFGARKVIASARHSQQAKAAEAMGADTVVGSEPGELEDACKAASDGRGADVVIETVGGEQIDTLTQSCQAVRSQGVVLNVGGARSPKSFGFLELLLREINIVSVTCYDVIDGRHDYEVAIDLLASGEVPYRDIVTHQFGLDQIQQGFDAAYDKSTGSIKVHVTQP